MEVIAQNIHILLLREPLTSFRRNRNRNRNRNKSSFAPSSLNPSHTPSLRCNSSALVSSSSFADTKNLEDAKYSLLKAVMGTERGLSSSPEERSVIEESMVAVESLDAGQNLDLTKVDGTWMLQYTTASDVVSILQASKFPFLKVGQIFQNFECAGNKDGGIVQNVVRWSVPGFLQDSDGATLIVTAKFTVVGSRNITLQFEEATFGGLLVSEEFQALIAPAFLPRTFFALEVLQFIRGFNARFPLRSNKGAGSNEGKGRTPLGLLYYISFVDNDMLIGRALGSGGVFIFSRTQPLQPF